MKLKVIAKRILIYFLLVVAAFILQTCVFPFLTFFAAVPNLILIITFSYGFIYGTEWGILCGFFAGLMMDLFYTEPFGLFILIYSYLGFFSGLFSHTYRSDSIILPLMLCLVSEVFYNFAILAYRYMTIGELYFNYSLVHIIIPEIFFTLLVTLVVYRLLLAANRRMDRIDELRGQSAA